MVPILVALSLILQTPEACPPKTVTCATGCVPLGESCPSAAELAPPPATPIESAPEITPLDSERPATAAETRREKHGCPESDRDFDRRRLVRLGAIGLPGVAAAIGGVVTMATMREPDYQDSGPNCTMGKPCGRTCIAWEDVCHVGTDAKTKMTTAGWAVTGSLIGLSLVLIFSAVFSSQRMKRRMVDCTSAGCSLTVRF
jgi:hypothetical protein